MREAQRLRIPIIGLVDTNCDPDGIDFVVPGNDDAIRSCYVVARAIGDHVAEGTYAFRAEEDRARQEAAEQARRQAEERARLEAEEQARRQAAEQARRDAEAAVTTAEGEGDRAAAEAEVAQAREELGREQPTADAAVRQSAQTETPRGRRRPRGRRSRRARAARGRPDADAGEPAGERGRRGGPDARPRRPRPSRPSTTSRRRSRRPTPGGARSRRRRGGRGGRRRPEDPRGERAPDDPRQRGTERMTTPTISASDVKELRQRTGAGMMDCKSALQEAGGDMDKAVEILRVRMGNKIGKLADRTASEGTIQSYIHANGKVGVLVEVDCNTDFVAKNEDFIEFAKEVALHIAASPTARFVSEDEVTDEAREAEVRVFEQQAADKPENIRPKIVEGRVKKWLEEVVLLNQTHVNEDKHESRTIEQMRADLSAKTGENVVIRRFTRFAVGE